MDTIAMAENTVPDMNRIPELLTKVLTALSSDHSVLIKKTFAGELVVELDPAAARTVDLTKSGEYLDRRQAAELIHHHPCWLSREGNRIKNGIEVHRIGGKNLYKRKDLLAVIERNRLKKRGRPRKSPALC